MAGSALFDRARAVMSLETAAMLYLGVAAASLLCSALATVRFLSRLTVFYVFAVKGVPDDACAESVGAAVQLLCV
jgi:energy-converting hydrogenase Eha subunit C